MVKEDEVAQNPAEEVVDDTPVAGDSQEGVKADSPPATEEQPATGGEQPAQTETQQSSEENVPFHQHPRFQKLTSQNRELRDLVRSQQETMAKLQGSVETMQTGFGNMQKPADNQPTLEQQQAIAQLKQMMGMDKLEGALGTIDSLKAQNAELSKAQEERAFAEEEKMLQAKIEAVGLKPGQTTEDVLDEVEDFIGKHPILNKMKGKPGTFTLAFDSMNAQRLGEVGKRAAQKEIIEQQEKQKRANSEQPGGQPLGGIKKKPPTSISGAGVTRQIDDILGGDDISF